MAKLIVLIAALGLLQPALSKQLTDDVNMSKAASLQDVLQERADDACRKIKGNGPDGVDCERVTEFLHNNDFKNVTCETCGEKNCLQMTGLAPDKVKDCNVIKKVFEVLGVKDVECGTCGAANLTISLFLFLGTAYHLLATKFG